jgi:hypothetical protein
MTCTSSSTERSSRIEAVLSYGLFTESPSTWYWISSLRPPRMCPSTTPAWRFTMSSSCWTGRVAISLRVTVETLLVRPSSTTGRCPFTTTSSSATALS